MSAKRELRVLGLGHIGAAIAARATSLGYRVSGWDRDPGAVRFCRSRSFITDGRNPAICIVAVPENAAGSSELKKALRELPRGTVVTDVFSSKGEGTRVLSRLCRELGLRFAWSHPLAGREGRGARSADPMIFDGATVLVDVSAGKPIVDFWKSLGCRVERMTAARHQRAMARGSHLAHVLAFAMKRVVARGGRVSPSVVSATRVAKSDPKAWQKIWLSNRDEVIRAISMMEAELKRTRRFLESKR